VKQAGLAEELWPLARFSAVGAIATVVHIGVAMIAVVVAGVNPTVGATIGFLSAFIVSHIGHFRFSQAGVGCARNHRTCLQLSDEQVLGFSPAWRRR
jgi:putative flippase GtrA